MNTYVPKNFVLPTLENLSPKQIEVHLKLYQGYVTHVNLIREKIVELQADSEKNSYLLSELRRRFAFEFDGMRMHEYYFEQFEGKAKEIDPLSTLVGLVSDKYGDWQKFIEHFRTVSMSRGIGWGVLYYDPVGNVPHVVYVGDHELGQLAGLPIILALDMWEHAFMVDYTPAEKKNYIDAFFKNLNWEVVEKRFAVSSTTPTK